MTTTERQVRIVVGVDGSESAQAALRWALRQAKLDGGRVEAVTVWHYPVGYGWDPGGADGDFEGTGRQILSAALAAADDLAAAVTVTPLVAEGYPGDVLLHAAKGADLLVLGRRGHSGFTSALIGSVSMHCVLHAQCPVLVLHDQPAEPEGKPGHDHRS
jgi:nucleotide-binding universal stress UspA family protein